MDMVRGRRHEGTSLTGAAGATQASPTLDDVQELKSWPSSPTAGHSGSSLAVSSCRFLFQASSALLSWTLDSGVATQELHRWSYKRRTWSACPRTVLWPVGTSGPAVSPLCSIYRLPPVLTSFNHVSRAPHPQHNLPSLLTPLAASITSAWQLPNFLSSLSLLLGSNNFTATQTGTAHIAYFSQVLHPVQQSVCLSSQLSLPSTPLSTCKSLACSPNLPVFDLQGPPLNKELPPKRCLCMGLN